MVFLKVIAFIYLGISQVSAGTPTYTFERTLSTPFTGTTIYGMAFDGASNLYTGLQSGSIYRFNANNQTNPTVPNFTYQDFSYGNWGRLAVDAAGNLYATAMTLTTGSHEVARFDAGTLESNLMSASRYYSHNVFDNITAVTFDSAGYMYVINTLNSVKRYGPPGTFNTLQATLHNSGFLSFNSTLAFDSQGNLYVNSTFFGDPAHVSVFSSSNLNDGATANAQIDLPSTPISSSSNGLVIDQNDNLYVADSNNNRILVYKSDGTLLTTIAVNASGSLAISPDGQYLYIATTNSVQVYKINPAVISSGNSIPSLSASIQQIIASQGLSEKYDAGFINALFGSTPREIALAAADPAASTNVAASISQIGTTSDSITNEAGTIHDIAAISMDQQDSSTDDGGFSFTSSAQRQSFNHLSNQLPFLKFQSVHSMVDPIIPGYNNNPVFASSPFEKQRPNLKPVFLSNERNHIWIQPFGGIERLDSYDQTTGMTIKNSGSSIGVGHRISKNVTLGLLAGGSVSSYALDQNNGNGNTASYYTGIYGGYKALNGFNLKGSMIFGQDKYTSQRNLTALSLSAKNTHKGWNASLHTQAGYTLKYERNSITPYVGIGVSQTKQNSYQETNAYPFNLNVPDSTTKTFSSEIGTKFERTMKMDETLIKPLVGLSISREAPLRKQGNTTLSFTDSSTPFAVPASNEIKTYANVSIGGTVMTATHVSVSALVTGKIKKHEQGAEAVLKVSYTF